MRKPEKSRIVQLRWIIPFVQLFFFLSGFAQTEPYLDLKLKLSVVDGNLDNTLVTITRNGSPYKSIDPSKSKYKLQLEMNATFIITVTKSGYISKSVIVDTHIPKGREDKEFAGFTSEIELNKQPEDQIITYTKPVGQIKYSYTVGDFDYDTDYSTQVQAQIKKDEASPKPKPKPEPPKTEPKVIVQTPTEPKVEPEKPKPVISAQEPEIKAVVKNKEERIIQMDRLKITIITVTIGTDSYEYKKEEYSWGGTYYYKDGKNITEATFTADTD